MKRKGSPIGSVVNVAIACGAVFGIVFGKIGEWLGWGVVEQIAAVCHVLSFVVMHMRFILNGEIVLGAKFLPGEVKRSIAMNRYVV
jgi:hypothetical protein